ncbi:MAG: DNA polymerase III subunit delta [Anaerofustis stercorihominis]|nr:DNA polymerase III subunit delta [Anaerofustis stercorihominis]
MKQLKAQLSSGIIGGLYLFITEDKFLSDSYIAQIEKKIIDPSFRALNYTEFSAGADEELLIRSLTGMPLMGDRRLVVCRTDDIKTKNDAKTEKLLDHLSEYISAPSEYTVLVVVCKNIDKRSSFYKLFKEKGKIAEFKKPKRSDFYDWIAGEFQKRGVNIQREAINHIISSVDYNGRESEVDMGYFINEIEKICMIDPKAKTITLDMVKKVTSPGVNADIFKLTDALTNGDMGGVHRQLYRLRYNNIPVLQSISTIATTMRNIAVCQSLSAKGMKEEDIAKEYSINPYSVKNSIAVRGMFTAKDALNSIKALANADIAIKTGREDEQTALQNVCMAICTKTFIFGEIN